ncbi:MAG: DEAD/DEAH box helicase [Planctomycetota bacterium]
MPEFSIDPKIDFDDIERELGKSLWEQGTVTLTANDDNDDGFFEAEVKHFNKRVWVSLRREGEAFTPECDCPHYDETNRGCEHLFALLLALADTEQKDGDQTDFADTHKPCWPNYLVLATLSEQSKGLAVALEDSKTGEVIPIDHDHWCDIEDSADIAAIRAMAPAAGGWRDPRRGGGLQHPHGPWTLRKSAIPFLREALPTGRVYLVLEDKSRLPLTELAATNELVLAPVGKTRGQIEILAFLRGVNDRKLRRLSEFSLIQSRTQPAIAIAKGVVFPVEGFGAEAWLKTLRRGPGLDLLAAEVAGFFGKMDLEHPLPRLAFTDDQLILPMESATQPRPCLELRFRGGLAHGILNFQYGEAPALALEKPGKLVLDSVHNRQYQRVAAAESAALETLFAYGTENDPDDSQGFMLDRESAVAMIPQLMESGFSIRVENRPVSRGRISGFKIRGKKNQLWVDGDVKIAGATDASPQPLASLLASYQRDHDFIELEEGGLAILDEESKLALKKALPLLDLAQGEEDGSLTFALGQAPIVETILQDQPKKYNKEFNLARERLDSWQKIKVLDPPKKLQASLRPYQLRGFSWLCFLDEVGLGGILADDMGLGKTIQTIAFLLHRKTKALKEDFLIVVPRSLIGNWMFEIERFAPSLEVSVYHGAKRKLKPPAKTAGKVILTTYGVLQRDTVTLGAVTFDTVVLDEAQAIKNSQSKTAHAARGLKAARRLALSGTPIENDLIELWSLMEFCNPGLLGTRRGFAQSWGRVETKDLEPLRRATAPLILRRTKKEVAPELPALVEQTVLCDMGEVQAGHYEALRIATQTRLEKKDLAIQSPVQVLEALLRLRQIACHPGLVGKSGDSGKIDLLLERLAELEKTGAKALVFSQFTSLLSIVRDSLRARGQEPLWLDGKTRDRETPIRRFQEETDERVFLISLKAGGTGLNLTAADVVFVLDPWWNPAAEAQAIARAHRIGRQGSVLAQRLVSRGTIEEAILVMQQEKRELANAILADSDATTKKLSLSDLSGLLAGG